MVRYIYAAANTPTTIEDLIQRDFDREGQKEPLTAKTWVRASSIAYMCAREEVLVSRTGAVRPNEFTGVDSQLIALHGTALHWAVQNQLLAPYLVGRWKCTNCGFCRGGYNLQEKGQDLHKVLHEAIESSAVDYEDCKVQALGNLIPRPNVCWKCGAEHQDDQWPLFEYEEQWWGDQDLLVGGHNDGFIQVPWRSGLGILEVKSIGNHRVWMVRDVPMEAHVIQLHVYMMLTNASWGILLYWDKGTNGVRGLIEHHVERKEAIIDSLKRSIFAVRKGLNGGPLPERLCARSDCPRAQKCVVRKLCFEEE
jgi:hypothetical protein